MRNFKILFRVLEKWTFWKCPIPKSHAQFLFQIQRNKHIFMYILCFSREPFNNVLKFDSKMHQNKHILMYKQPYFILECIKISQFLWFLGIFRRLKRLFIPYCITCSFSNFICIYTNANYAVGIKQL